MNSSQHNDQKAVMDSLQPCSNSDSTSLADALTRQPAMATNNKRKLCWLQEQQ
jgi:hypothetical protein